MAPSQVIDELAAAYYGKLTEGVAVPSWDELPDFRKERHRRAVRSLLLRQMELSDERSAGVVSGIGTGPAAHDVMTEPERLKLVERLKRRAG